MHLIREQSNVKLIKEEIATVKPRLLFIRVANELAQCHHRGYAITLNSTAVLSLSMVCKNIWRTLYSLSYLVMLYIFIYA
ncbi:hypothetical protein Y032_0260g531 [Ancylostoma ceylanicum]|uniref:Uncharacterized protein n=1 Tax=Ancylostoma ceylanicum TaxID=53326 RepID=A0A016SB78_9BILA|nr:hypothetical protein Y032_0260g531 [Ancylostoma ceylanicum]